MGQSSRFGPGSGTIITGSGLLLDMRMHTKTHTPTRTQKETGADAFFFSWQNCCLFCRESVMTEPRGASVKFALFTCWVCCFLSFFGEVIYDTLAHGRPFHSPLKFWQPKPELNFPAFYVHIQATCICEHPVSKRMKQQCMSVSFFDCKAVQWIPLRSFFQLLSCLPLKASGSHLLLPDKTRLYLKKSQLSRFKCTLRQILMLRDNKGTGGDCTKQREQSPLRAWTKL